MTPAARMILTLALLPVLSSRVAAQDAEPTRQTAQNAYISGDFAGAKSIIEKMLAECPSDPDLLRRLALVEAATGHLDAALQTINRALALAPHDSDIQLARANILLWRGNLSASQKEREEIGNENGNFPDLADFDVRLGRVQVARKARLASLSIGQSVSRANFQGGEVQTWTVQRGTLALKWADRSLASIEVEREKRLTVDTRISARIDFPAGPQHAFLVATFTPNADFKENWSVAAGAELNTNGVTVFLADVRFADYRDASIGVLNLGVRRNFGRGLSLTAHSINLFKAREPYRVGGSVQAELLTRDGTSLFAALASYPDTEVNGTRQLKSVGAGAVFLVNDRLSLRLSADYESRKDSYDRVGINLNLSWRFGR